MATRKTDEDPTDAAARGDTPQNPELARALDEVRNLRAEVTRLDEENKVLRGQGTRPPADDAGKSRSSK
jgi:hypothetical protein